MLCVSVSSFSKDPRLLPLVLVRVQSGLDGVWFHRYSNVHVVHVHRVMYIEFFRRSREENREQHDCLRHVALAKNHILECRDGDCDGQELRV